MLLLTWPLRHNTGVVTVLQAGSTTTRRARTYFEPPAWSTEAEAREREYGDGFLEDREYMLRESLDTLRGRGVDVMSVLEALADARWQEYMHSFTGSANAIGRQKLTRMARRIRRWALAGLRYAEAFHQAYGGDRVPGSLGCRHAYKAALDALERDPLLTPGSPVIAGAVYGYNLGSGPAPPRSRGGRPTRLPIALARRRLTELKVPRLLQDDLLRAVGLLLPFVRDSDRQSPRQPASPAKNP